MEIVIVGGGGMERFIFMMLSKIQMYYDIW